MATFIKENIEWRSKQKPPKAKHIRKWYDSWRTSASCTAHDDAQKNRQEQTMLRSRAKKTDSERLRGPGGGRQYACPLIRQALYEWFVSIRYAIDWHQLVATNKKKERNNIWRVFLAQF